MKNILSIYILSVLLVSLSCSRGASVDSSANQKDYSSIFEIDSSLINDDEERGYLSIGDMEPFNMCSPVGSIAYGKDYNIDVFMLPESDSAYIVMSEMFSTDKKGNPLWRMVDSVKIYFPIGSSIGWPGSVVRNDAVDYTLMALMPEDNDWVDTEVYDQLLGVWCLDAGDKSIETVSVENVSCINESYGVY